MAAATPLMRDIHEPTYLACLQQGLKQALSHAGITITTIEPLADSGLAHAHFRLTFASPHHASGGVSADWIARLPKQSQMQLSAAENLTYQTACFERCQPSQHTPHLHGTLAPQPDLPRGGLLVEAITGRAARLPDDLPAIAETLASLHALPVPATQARAPLLAPACPWRAMFSEIQAQCHYLDGAGLSRESRRLIESEREALTTFLDEQPAPSAISLISFDAHPGNFLIEEGSSRPGASRAVLVDLEKCRYGLPGFDLAHATLYTSTTWDIASHAVLDIKDVVETYRLWRQHLLASGADPRLLDTTTLLQSRRAMWLWSLSWCAKWLALNQRPQDSALGGEDWSSELSGDSLVRHVRERANHYLTANIMSDVIHEWHQLAHRL